MDDSQGSTGEIFDELVETNGRISADDLTAGNCPTIVTVDARPDTSYF